MTEKRLRGMTWSHPRGYEPLEACSAIWERETGIEVRWDKRSLQDFESYPVRALAERYDLIVIDHPHVGQITREGCLMPLDVAGREPERKALADGSVGLSYASYDWQGRQWALPIDAATQVQAWRPDRITAPLVGWDEVVEHARAGRILVPMRPPHSLMVLYTLTGNLGRPCRVAGPDLVDPEAGRRAYEMILELTDLLGPACFTMDPIAVLDRMSEAQATFVAAPLIYGYVSYARAGFRPARIAFADMPVAGAAGPIGSALGGTGIAVSAMAREPRAAIDFAYWIASAATQRGIYAAAGGQPGHAAAWEDPAVNEPVAEFYRATRATLDRTWLRPRHDGYMTFQNAAAKRLNAALAAGESGRDVIADLNALFAASLQPG